MEDRRRYLATDIGGLGTFRRAAQALARGLFPHFCQGCGQEGPILCADCRAETAARLAGIFICPGCGQPSPFGRQCGRPVCRRRSPLEGLVSMASYRNPALRKLLHAYKYEGVDEAGETLDALFGTFLSEKREMLAAVLSGAKVAAVPLHPFRRASRGFDQCEKFLARLASCLDSERSAVLSRKFRFRTQVSIASAEIRRRNAAGSIVCRTPAADGKFVIFDDVTTTRATLDECAKALKKAGASQVWAVTLLRG